MSEIIHHRPGGRIEYSGPVGKVWAVGGRQPQRRDALAWPHARRSASASYDEDGWAGVEHTAPYPINAREERTSHGQASGANTSLASDDTAGSPEYWKARRAYEARIARITRPDYQVRGVCCPYGLRLPNDQGDLIVFDQDTEWGGFDHRGVPLLVDHGSRFLGYANVVELATGLHVDGRIGGPLKPLAGNRHSLSVGLGEYICRERGGVLHVDRAELREVSLVDTPRWPDTRCTLIPIAA